MISNLISLMNRIGFRLFGWLAKKPIVPNNAEPDKVTRADIEQYLREHKESVIDFQNTDLSGIDLSDLDLCEANLSGANLTHTSFRRTKLKDANLRETICIGTNFLDADLTGALLYNAVLESARLTSYSFRDITIRYRKVWRVGDIIHAYQTGHIEDFHKAREACLSIANTLFGQGQFEDATAFRIMAMRAHREVMNPLRRYKRHRDFGRSRLYSSMTFGGYVFRWLGVAIPDILSVYGESIWRVVTWIGLVILVIGPLTISLTGGLDWKSADEEFQRLQQLSDPIIRWSYFYLQHVVYMIDTFTTANFSVLKPSNDLVRLISSVYAFMGIFFAGLLGFVAGNKSKFV